MHNCDMSQFSDYLKQARASAGMTQVEMVEALKAQGVPCSMSLYTKIESGQKDAQAHLIIAAANVLRHDVNKLLSMTSIPVIAKEALPCNGRK